MPSPAELTCLHCGNRAAPCEAGDLPRGWHRLGDDTRQLYIEECKYDWGDTHAIKTPADLFFCSRAHLVEWVEVALDNHYHLCQKENAL